MTAETIQNPSRESRAQQQPPVPPETDRFLRWLFSYHVLTIRQKVLAIAQKYYVRDDQGIPRFFVVRPPKLGLNFLAGLASFVIRILALILAVHFIFFRGDIVAGVASFLIGGWVGEMVAVLLRPYRDIGVYTDDTEQFQVLFITQDNKFGLYHRYTVYDPLGQPAATARRNLLKSLGRRQWVAESLEGRPLLKVREDSLFLAIVRRLPLPFVGFLRTNFDFVLPDGKRIGEYNRKLTLTDQYILNLGDDPHYLVDRRVALALAILLDTAEGR